MTVEQHSLTGWFVNGKYDHHNASHLKPAKFTVAGIFIANLISKILVSYLGSFATFFKNPPLYENL